ncbi:MAG: hypothetical protein KC435_10390 [Thermomicrobiales bacterium]|nr:hypothetical protein [Thermomicrobiales bacterium]
MIPASTLAIPAPQLRKPARREWGHYRNIAAILALVVALVLGGWFARNQLPPESEPTSRFAVLGLQTEGTACDVEPLTVDQAIVIMKNPFTVIDLVLYDMTGMHAKMSGQEYAVPAHSQMTQLMTHNPRNDIDQDEWAETLELGNRYLDCIQNGTVGQVLALMDPFVVQGYLRDQLPLFMNEEATRSFLADLLQGSAIEYGWTDSDQLAFVSDKVLQINPDFGLIYADSTVLSRNGFYTEVIGAPVLFSHSDGTVASAPTFAGMPFGINVEVTRFARNVFFVKSAFDGQWYVFGIFIP